MLEILVKETSRGPVAFEFVPRIWGVRSVSVAAVDERGLTARQVRWNNFESGGGTLAEAIEEAAGLPAPEAEELAAAVMTEWEARDRVLSRTDRAIARFMPLVMLVLAPLSLLWIVIWVILQLI